jgi:hypothetical protein
MKDFKMNSNKSTTAWADLGGQKCIQGIDFMVGTETILEGNADQNPQKFVSPNYSLDLPFLQILDPPMHQSRTTKKLVLFC